MEVALPLRHSSAEHDLRKEVTAYLHRYYASMSQDMERLSKGIYLANLLFNISALYRLAANAVIDLQRIEPASPEDIRKLIHDFCFAFACHDSLMGGLRTGAFGHRPQTIPGSLASWNQAPTIRRIRSNSWSTGERTAKET